MRRLVGVALCLALGMPGIAQRHFDPNVLWIEVLSGHVVQAKRLPGGACSLSRDGVIQFTVTQAVCRRA